jgi:hypothetical protein
MYEILYVALLGMILVLDAKDRPKYYNTVATARYSDEMVQSPFLRSPKRQENINADRSGEHTGARTQGGGSRVNLYCLYQWIKNGPDAAGKAFPSAQGRIGCLRSLLHRQHWILTSICRLKCVAGRHSLDIRTLGAAH